jgi:hypothetical protein
MIEEKSFWQEAGMFFTRASTYVFPILFGLMGRYGLELAMRKKYTLAQWIGISFVSLFAGYITSRACTVYNWEVAQDILPSLATMFGYNGAMYIVYNYRRLGDIVVEVISRKKP